MTFGYTNDSVLVYYKKGNLTWGNPVASDCKSLLREKTVDSLESPVVHINPNPVSGHAFIVLLGYTVNNLTCTFHDITGRVVLSFKCQSFPYPFNCEGLAGGIYFVTLKDEVGNLIGKCRMIKE